jgi:drug/metabolite transporter (DMT)-like permease
MRAFYAGLGVICGIAGIAAITYGLMQGRHGSSAITSGIVMLVVAASTVYARRGVEGDTSGAARTGSAPESAATGRAQGLPPRQLYVVIGLVVLFTVVAFAVADAIGAPTTGPGPPAVIVLIGCIVGCSVYGLATKAFRHRAADHPHTR